MKEFVFEPDIRSGDRDLKLSYGCFQRWSLDWIPCPMQAPLLRSGSNQAHEELALPCTQAQQGSDGTNKDKS